MPSIWFMNAAKELATIWERQPAPSGATYAPYAAGVKCYHYPEKPRDDEIAEFGNLAATVYVWVFDEPQILPRQLLIVSGGAGYVSMNQPVKTPSIGLGRGGNVQVRTHLLSPLPPGVTL